MSALLTVAELSEIISGPGAGRPALVDVRWTLGKGAEGNRDEYAAAHLPGAVFLDLESALSEPVREDGAGGRHPMPSRERVEAALQAAGVRAGMPVVFYDQARSLGAARAWWVARQYGLESRVLDGGLAAWQEAGLPVEAGEVQAEPGDVRLTAEAADLLDADGLLAFQADGGQVVDARPADRFRGENETMDPVAGHVPGARSLPALSLVEAGVFADEADLRRRVEEAGIEPGRPLAVYCGSGVQAAHVALALQDRMPELGRPSVYVGSWSDWVTDPSRPVETGPAR